MKWRAEFATGNKEIDDQHKSLFSFSEEFRDVLDRGFGGRTYGDFLEFLHVYTDTHFDFEDKCMLAHLCPIAGQNRVEHGSFTHLLEIEEVKFANTGFDRERAYKLLAMIDKWLESHICRIDVQLREYITA